MKTENMHGIILDWFVAKCVGLDVGFSSGRPCYWQDTYDGPDDFSIPKYSSDWKVGGPLMEKLFVEGLCIIVVDPSWDTLPKYKSTMTGWDTAYYSDSILDCVMVTYVTSKLGYEIDIPTELSEYVKSCQK